MSIEGKSIIFMGAGSGIGRAVVELFLVESCAVRLDSRPPSASGMTGGEIVG